MRSDLEFNLLTTDDPTLSVIQIDYEPGSADPARVFRAMAKLIDAFHATDRDLVGALGVSIEPFVVLERVEAGSIRTWLRTILRGVPDDTLNNLDWRPIIGQYLVRAKHRMLGWLGDHDAIDNRSQLGELQEIIVAELPFLSEDNRLLQAPLIPERLLSDIAALSEAVRELAPGDKVSFEGAGEKTPVNVDLRLSTERVEEILTQRTHRSDAELVLLVKKPDYLGRSRWEFRYDSHVIEAHVRDEDWLSRFRNGYVVLRPGDALQALVRSEIHVGFEGQVVGTKHEIIQVIRVVPAGDSFQEDILDGNT